MKSVLEKVFGQFEKALNWFGNYWKEIHKGTTSTLCKNVSHGMSHLDRRLPVVQLIVASRLYVEKLGEGKINGGQTAT